MDCSICRNMKNGQDQIYETRYWAVSLAADQGYLGRCYITLKRHCGDMAELEKTEWSDFAGLVKRLEDALRKAFGAAMFNWSCLMNDAYQNQPPNPMSTGTSGPGTITGLNSQALFLRTLSSATTTAGKGHRWFLKRLKRILLKRLE